MTILLAIGMGLVVVVGAVAFMMLMIWLVSEGYEWIVAVFVVLFLVAIAAMILYPLAGKLLGTTG